MHVKHTRAHTCAHTHTHTSSYTDKTPDWAIFYIHELIYSPATSFLKTSLTQFSNIKYWEWDLRYDPEGKCNCHQT